MHNWLKKYFSLSQLAVLGFVVYVLFLNEYSLGQKLDNRSEIRRLNAEIAMSEDTLQFYTKKIKELNTSREVLESTVREHFYMQRPSEDVYIFN